MSSWLLVSATEEEAARLDSAGPRRDFTMLAERLAATRIFRGEGHWRGWRGRLLGPHVRQAWEAAGRVQSGDHVFADGEHVGLPFLFASLLHLRRPTVVMIGHMPARWW